MEKINQKMLPIFIVKSGSPKRSQPETCQNSHSIYGLFLFFAKGHSLQQKCPQNWNTLLPSMDSPIVWVSNGKAFNKKATGLMMYQLIGQLALHLGSLQDKLQEGMVTDVMGDIEVYTNYYSLLEDICNAESSEGYESEFNALSMHIKDVLYKHFLFIEGHKLIQGL